MSRSRPPAPQTVAEKASRRRVIRFLVVFGVLLAAYYLVILFPQMDHLLYHYLVVNAHLANGLLRAVGFETQVEETTIRSLQYAVSVRRGCDALEPAWFFSAAMLAFPAPVRRKLAPLTAGIAVILALNLVRIASLFVIGERAPQFFATAHLEIWPVIFLLSAVGLWLAWIRRLNRPTSPAHAPA